MNQIKRRQVRLVDDAKAARLIRYQVHAPEPWIDPITREPTSYLCGFEEEARRAAYVKMMGLDASDTDQ